MTFTRISVAGVWKTVFNACRLAAGASRSFLGAKKSSQAMLGIQPGPVSRVENTSLIAALEAAMLNPLCALQCLYAPTGFGKSRAVANAAKTLEDQNRLRGLVIIGWAERFSDRLG